MTREIEDTSLFTFKDWKEYLLNLLSIVDRIKRRDIEYKHGLKIIPISRIAQQYYCELKVENTFKFGELET